MIHRFKNPQCFKNQNVFSKLKLDYKSSGNAWMTASIFSDRLNDVNKEMFKQKRKIALILDNASVHQQNIELSNIELHFLPPKTTSVLHPLDNSVINSFKVRYRNNIRNKILFDILGIKKKTIIRK